MEQKSKALNSEERTQDFRSRGNICFKNKNFPDAIRYYGKGLELEPDNPHLNNNMAQACLEIRDFKRAECHAVKAIRFHTSAKGYYRAAKACVGQGEILRARTFLENGIKTCSDSNTQDLKAYLQRLVEDSFSRTEAAFRRSQEDISGTEEVPPLISDSEPDEEYVNYDKFRSQSVSRVPTSTSHLNSNKTSTVTQRSVSVSRTSNSGDDIKAGKTPKKKNKKRDHMEQNPFIARLASIKKEMGIHDITPDKFWSMQRNELRSLMKEGSELMGRGLSRRAVEKYKTALDMVLDHSVESFGMKEIDLVVLKYAVCVGWIDLASYGEIVKAVEHLKDIEDTRASKFPAVFYGLGSAFYKLNRYKIATEHLEKGLLFLKREVKFEVHSWPGTDDIIPETTRNGLQEVLKELLKTCRAYHEPDAICRYSKCRNISSHFSPSEHIFYSDPDFCGFVVVYCQEKCRIEYHLGCWKDYKETVMSDEIGKLTEKDFIGRSCPTTDCVTQTNERSVITKIEIVGDDTTVKASIEAPRSDTAIKESKKTKKKKGDKNAEAAVQDKPKGKLHPKTKKSIAEMIQTASQEMQASSSSEELVSRLDKLRVLRDVNFGYTNDNHWNPKENYLGREDVRRLDHFLGPEFTEETEEIRGRKEFVFSYFYEFIRNEGPQKMIDLEQKWQTVRDDFEAFEGISDFLNPHTNICSFLRQSYRFVSVDDNMCLAEQLAETYKKAKTELVQSLSFTLMGAADCTKLLHDTSEHPILNSDHIDPELKLRMIDTLNTHNYVVKPSVETMLRSFVDIPPGSTNDNEVFIAEAEVGDLVEDPDIHTAEDMLPAKRLPAASIESVIERDSLGIIDSSSDGSDELESRSDEFHDDDDDDDDDDNDDDDDDDDDDEEEEVCEDGLQQVKNQMTHKENAAQNHEKENKSVKEKKTSKQIEEELAKSLNPDANEFKPIEVVVLEHGELKSHSEGNVEAKTGARIVPSPVDNIHLIGTASGVPSFQSAGLKLGKWSSADGQPKVSTVPFTHLSSQKTADPLAVSLAHPVVCMPTFTSPVVPSQQSKMSDSTTQTNEMQNFEEEMVILKRKVKELEQQLEDGTSEKETLKKNLESKLDQQDKKIKELELEMAKVVEECNKDTKLLKEKLTKKEQECEAEKAMLIEEKKEREKSESHTKEIMRNLISETGQKVKELEEELMSRKHDMTQYQALVLEAKKEAREIQISFLEQKCKDTLNAMHCKMRHVMDLDVPKKTEVAAAIKKWEEYCFNLNEHEVQFRVYCSSLKEKLGSINVADLTLKWPVLPEPPTCPEDILEEMTQKALDEREDVKGKLLTQDKAVTEMNDDQWKTLPAVEEQYLKLKKTVENRQENISNSVISKEQAQDPNKTLKKLSEVAKKVDPSNLKEEEKMEKKSEVSVGTDKQGLKQNVHSNIYTSLPSANAALPINSVAGVPYFQPSTQHYGQPLIHNSPYFYNVSHMNYASLGMALPVVYGQQQSPPVTSLGSAFQHSVPPASTGSDKASAQQQVEPKPAPNSFAAETSRALVISTDMADKSLPQLESPTVPKKKKSPSPTSGLTPIEYTRNVSVQSGTVVATSQGISDPVVTKALPVSTSAVGVPKQNLPQVSKPAETQKPLVQTPCSISAATTVESRQNVMSAPKPKKGSSFQKLMDQLRKNFPSKTEEELSTSVAAVRERNNNSLTGLTLPTIINKVDKFLKEKANKQGSMGMDRFGTAWCGVRDSASSWSKSNDTSEDDCIICMEPMTNDQTSLQCKHSFHTKCIRQWLQTESICPMCRVFTRMADEFPPLS